METFVQTVLIIALNVYHEARGESEEGQIAVAYVTTNRMKIRNQSAWEVVTAPWQFSWTMELDDWTPNDRQAWRKALEVTLDVLKENTPDPTGQADHYHNKTVTPWWSTVPEMKHTVTIGNHIFYRYKGA